MKGSLPVAGLPRFLGFTFFMILSFTATAEQDKAARVKVCSSHRP
jgi:hypothetical protein